MSLRKRGISYCGNGNKVIAEPGISYCGSGNNAIAEEGMTLQKSPVSGEFESR